MIIRNKNKRPERFALIQLDNDEENLSYLCEVHENGKMLECITQKEIYSRMTARPENSLTYSCEPKIVSPKEGSNYLSRILQLGAVFYIENLNSLANAKQKGEFAQQR